jgi:hypothetical protein
MILKCLLIQKLCHFGISQSLLDGGNLKDLSSLRLALSEFYYWALTLIHFLMANYYQ